MKSSLIWMSLLALASVGVANADTNTAPAQKDTIRYDVSCSFARPGFECDALSRILLSTADAQTDSAQPAWYGSLLAVACHRIVNPPAPLSLISASDATLYSITGDPFTRWQIQNSDDTVVVNLTDHPFGDHPVLNVGAQLQVSGHNGHLDGHCDVIPQH